MKKIAISLSMLVTTTLLMAGGNISSNLSAVAEIPAKPCKENKIYIEKDVQLMWQDQFYTEEEIGAFKNNRSTGKVGTQSYAAHYCEGLNYGDYADWRLPTSDELAHVHQKDDQVFTYFTDNDFWTSTPTVEGKYYVVFPADAMIYARSKKQSNFVRCVRCIVE